MDGLLVRPSAVCAGTRLNNKCFIRDKQHASKDNLKYQSRDLCVEEILQCLL